MSPVKRRSSSGGVQKPRDPLSCVQKRNSIIPNNRSQNSRQPASKWSAFPGKVLHKVGTAGHRVLNCTASKSKLTRHMPILSCLSPGTLAARLQDNAPTGKFSIGKICKICRWPYIANMTKVGQDILKGVCGGKARLPGRDIIKSMKSTAWLKRAPEFIKEAAKALASGDARELQNLAHDLGWGQIFDYIVENSWSVMCEAAVAVLMLLILAKLGWRLCKGRPRPKGYENRDRHNQGGMDDDGDDHRPDESDDTEMEDFNSDDESLDEGDGDTDMGDVDSDDGPSSVNPTPTLPTNPSITTTSPATTNTINSNNSTGSTSNNAGDSVQNTTNPPPTPLQPPTTLPSTPAASLSMATTITNHSGTRSNRKTGPRRPVRIQRVHPRRSTRARNQTEIGKEAGLKK